jgi:hypothetical protein
MNANDLTTKNLHSEINKAMRAREMAAARRQTAERDALDRTIEDLIRQLNSYGL